MNFVVLVWGLSNVSICPLSDGSLLEVLQEQFLDLTDEEQKFIPMVTPHHFLMFATGAAQVPVTGFDPIPSIHFVHDESKSVPSASACSNTLYFYVNETTIHNPIHRYLVTALMNGEIFSKIWMSLPSKCMKYAASRYEGVFGKSKECFTFFFKLSQVEKNYLCTVHVSSSTC